MRSTPVKDRRGAGGRLVPPSAVRRDRLERRLDRVPPGGLGMVVATAGSGKSVLLSQWAAARPGLPVCSVTLAPRHNDAVVLGDALIEAIGSTLPGLGSGLGALLMTGGKSLGEPFLDRLLDDVETHGDDLVIVFDDAHVLTNPSLVSELDGVLGRIPPNVRILIAARWDPPLQLRRLRMAGRLVEVRAEDLAFDHEEGRQLLSGVSGHDLTDVQVKSLVSRTDGWAAGLQLAAISLQSSPDVAAFVDAFTGTDRLVVEYLTEEVLDTQDDATRRFLLRSSVLPWLSAELCASVTGEDDAREMLDFLVQRSLFLVPLDRRGERFRYHHLFADLLRYRLRVEYHAEAEVELRRSAAEWLRAHGHTADAIEQLLAAGDRMQAFEVIVGQAQSFFERRESASLVRWLSAVDEAPDAPAAVGVNLLAAQVAANEFVAATETHRRLRRRADLTAGEQAASDALYCCLGLDELAPLTVIDAAAGVLDTLRRLDGSAVTDFLGIGGPETTEIMAEFMAAFARFQQGDIGASSAQLERVATLPGMQYVVWRIHVFGALALMRAWRGRLTEAQQLAQRALGAAAEAGIPHHVAVIHAHAAMGLVAIERNETTEATRCLGEAALLSQRRRGAYFIDMQRLLDSRLATMTDGPRHSLGLLRRPAVSAIDLPLLAHTTRAMEARLLISLGQLVQARTVLQHTTGNAVLVPVTIDLDLAEGNVAAARHEVDRWHADPTDPTEVVEHLIRVAAVLDAEGRHAEARAVVTDAASSAEIEGLRRPFLDVPSAIRLIAPSAQRSSQRFLRSLVDAASNPAAGRAGQPQLIEALTERELALLEFLPSRLANGDIAAALYVSVNTVKTHLRNIYRKLDVADRDAAVERARAIGLI